MQHVHPPRRNFCTRYSKLRVLELGVEVGAVEVQFEKAVLIVN